MNGERGYTIVEVMIFLAISGALFFSAMVLIGGQQNKVRFSQGMRDIDSKVQDIVNDVSSGYFPTAKDISCVDDNTSDFLAVSSLGTNVDVGQNEQCILLGKVLHFSPNKTPNFLNIYSVVGLRSTKSTQYAGESYQQEVEKLDQTKPTALVEDVDITESFELQSGIRLKSASTLGDSATIIGVYSSLGGSELTAADTSEATKKDVFYRLKSGSQNAQAIDFRSDSSRTGYVPPDLNTTKEQVRDIIKNQSKFGYGLLRTYSLCFESSTGDQTALLSIGQNGRSISTKLEFITC